MDRGGDRDLLSSGFFDGGHDHLYNKRMTANDSSRKTAMERETVSEQGRYYFHSNAFSHAGVMFHRPRQDSSVI